MDTLEVFSRDDYRHKVQTVINKREHRDTVPMNLPEKLVRDKATVPLEQKDGRAWLRGSEHRLRTAGEERPA